MMRYYLAAFFIVITVLLPDIYAHSENLLLSSVQADYILVEKSARRMTLLAGYRILKKYKISLGSSPVGTKVQLGDNRTPEGIYVIDFRNPESQYHLSLHLSYPDIYDRKKAELLDVHPGGNIMIHGMGKKFAWMGKAHVLKDWTNGCIAVTDDEIEEVWHLIPDGTKIEIRP